jgi:uncharacterized protein (DUF1778 family)
MNAPVERGRITARVSNAVAERLQEAAELTGSTLNQFVVQSALENAQRIIDRERTIFLTREDAALLLDLLDTPPAPNEAMTRAFARYKTEKYGADSGGPES